MNGRMQNFNEYWDEVETIEKTMPLGKLPGVKMDLHAIADYVKKTGKLGYEMTDEELAMFVDDVPKLKKFREPYLQN